MVDLETEDVEDSAGIAGVADSEEIAGVVDSVEIADAGDSVDEDGSKRRFDLRKLLSLRNL